MKVIINNNSNNNKVNNNRSIVNKVNYNIMDHMFSHSQFIGGSQIDLSNNKSS